ncbi:SIMPL domain-containing protein [Caminicella sporogenes]|uniref:SIMPL domain-containing protein n=1 Tax=Caminicella sporogenes TaxID=166485 RepID=UPI00254098BD|nr:SIMPL domain-containing protein [Caminicella sporogenes]WIF95407.1 SIMPL domain-containing protein [Caminicella sporogenes]
MFKKTSAKYSYDYSYKNPFKKHDVKRYEKEKMKKEIKESKEEKRCSYILELEGKGTVKVKPDVATVTLGVITENEELEVAKIENSRKVERVLEVLKEMGIDDDDLQTETFSIEPQYDYEGGKKVFRGFKVTNKLTITIRNLEKIGEIIDTAVDSGANIVESIKFSIAQPDTYYNEALNLAILNTIEKARSIEHTLKVKVNMIPIKITEESYGYAYPVERTYMEAVDTTTIIQSGLIEITARVNTVFDYE